MPLRVATGERAGRRVRRVFSDPAQGIRSAPLCFAARSFSVHAATTVQAHDHGVLARHAIDRDRIVPAAAQPWAWSQPSLTPLQKTYVEYP